MIQALDFIKTNPTSNLSRNDNNKNAQNDSVIFHV